MSRGLRQYERGIKAKRPQYNKNQPSSSRLAFLEIHICPVTQGHSWQCGRVVTILTSHFALSRFDSRWEC
ncbi:unnamed protein product [Protopolystoma xenopodis]|uniref:Uncharacterized protein n=1 Tax=Protopolystoma xenopodis TaxID=117903 RepID=A0A448XB21_9PLAT|nr:unnamed protein product [Protopolystoma xenopodis]